jgi:hypothetical protein
MLSVISVVIQSECCVFIKMLSVVMLSVVAPYFYVSGLSPKSFGITGKDIFRLKWSEFILT